MAVVVRLEDMRIFAMRYVGVCEVLGHKMRILYEKSPGSRYVLAGNGASFE